MLAYYISIVFFIMVLNSRLAGAVVGYFVTGFSLFLLTGDEALTQMHIYSKIAHVAVHVLSYIIPSAAGIIKLMEQVYSQGFGAFQWGPLGFIIASCIPFFVISYYLVRRREF